MIAFSVVRARNRLRAGFTLPEGIFSMAIMGVVFVSLYTGMTTGFNTIRRSRDNLRSTQILLEKFETIRLYTWTQINTPGFVPTNFVAYFDPGRTNMSTNGHVYVAPGGTAYQGVVRIEPAPVTEPYSNDLRRITVELTWNANGAIRKREMSSYVARYGLQNYIY